MSYQIKLGYNALSIYLLSSQTKAGSQKSTNSVIAKHESKFRQTNPFANGKAFKYPFINLKDCFAMLARTIFYYFNLPACHSVKDLFCGFIMFFMKLMNKCFQNDKEIKLLLCQSMNKFYYLR